MNKIDLKIATIVFFTLLLYFYKQNSAYADVIWPALLYVEKWLTWWIIGLSLIIEWPIFKWILNYTWFKSLRATIIINLISTLFGIPLIPLGGTLAEIFPGFIFYHFFNIGTFDPISWVVEVIFGAALCTLIELISLRIIYKIPISWKSFGLLLLANTLTVGLAATIVFSNPIDFKHI